MIYAKTGSEEEGEGLLDQALEKAVKTGIVRNILNAYRTRAEFYHGLDDYRKASDNYQEYSRLIHRTSTETYDLIMNLLNWSRTQRNRITIKPGIFNITELLNETSQPAENQAGRKNITVEHKTVENINVYADKDLISIVVRNLLNNAVKFTPQGGIVSLRAV